MSTVIRGTHDLRALVEACADRSRLAPLLAALGVAARLEPVPRHAWAAYGLAGAEAVDALAVVGRAGSLEALLIETTSSDPEAVGRLARRVRRENPARLYLYLVAGCGYDWVSLGTFGLDGQLRSLVLHRAQLRDSDLEALEEMVPGAGEVGLELALRHARALDRSRVTRRFFHAFRGRRAAVAAAWTGLPDEAGPERAQLALLFLSRLTFLYFLQRRRALAGDDRYLVHLFGQWAREADGAAGESFYRRRLVPLFFGALNRRPTDRDPAALALGDLPYLNGGLFERHALERRFPQLDLPDGEVRAALDELLEPYRFIAREDAESGGHGVDPEVLGRVFEGLMEPERRGDTASFYTPSPVVQRVVREAVATYVGASCSAASARAVVDGRGRELPEPTRYRVRSSLERVRVLDPACGSGAFLLGALQRLTVSLTGVTSRPVDEVRRNVVARSLHGVDLLDDAALLCSLRLWLALAADGEEIRPLPNLDRRIRQGDALVDPLTLDEPGGAEGSGGWRPRRDPALRHALDAVRLGGRRYLDSAPEERGRRRGALRRAEQRLARRWIEAARRSLEATLRELRARAADRDLFGQVPAGAHRAASAVDRVRARLRELVEAERALSENGALPFFSFGVHFADIEGFDLIISNPPWIRSHRWPDRVRRFADRYEVCRSPGWRRAAELTGAPAGAGAQVDLSLLFVERSLRLLSPGGVLATLIPTKAMRALYGGAARRILLRDLEFALIEDHSLDPRSIFDADAFTTILVGRRTGTAGGSPVQVRMIRRDREPLRFRVRQRDLPLFPGDPESPWLLAPPAVARVFRRMQAAGPPLGEHRELRVRRGIMTGANDVLLFRSVKPKLAGLAEVQAEGYERVRRKGATRRVTGRYRGVVELAGLRPLVRGADVAAFRFEVGGHTTWCHDARGRPCEAPARLSAYLERHRDRLTSRSGWRPALPLGAVFRLGPHTLQPKVAWHDLSHTLCAVALPDRVPVQGVPRELIPLNTVYFVPTEDIDTAMLLAGLLNALPVTTFARAVAERAKDARFRFFAWTVSALPLPLDWRASPAARAVSAISKHAHRRGGIEAGEQDRLDRAVARLYGLDGEDLDPVRQFDAWLRGEG